MLCNMSALFLAIPPLASTNIKQCRDQLPFSGDVKAERHSGRSTSGMPFFWLTFQRAVF